MLRVHTETLRLEPLQMVAVTNTTDLMVELPVLLLDPTEIPLTTLRDHTETLPSEPKMKIIMVHYHQEYQVIRYHRETKIYIF